MSVEKWRGEIDALDQKILKLLNDRARATQNIGKIKLKEGQGEYSPEREKQVLDRLKSLNNGPITQEAIEAIYREIMSSALSLEKRFTIAYLGPEFTYTHQAAQKNLVRRYPIALAQTSRMSLPKSNADDRTTALCR